MTTSAMPPSSTVGGDRPWAAGVPFLTVRQESVRCTVARGPRWPRPAMATATIHADPLDLTGQVVLVTGGTGHRPRHHRPLRSPPGPTWWSAGAPSPTRRPCPARRHVRRLRRARPRAGRGAGRRAIVDGPRPPRRRREQRRRRPAGRPPPRRRPASASAIIALNLLAPAPRRPGGQPGDAGPGRRRRRSSTSPAVGHCARPRAPPPTAPPRPACSTSPRPSPWSGRRRCGSTW